MADWLKQILLALALTWSLALVVSLLIVGAYYLPDPWSWVCGIFVFATSVGIAAGLCAYFYGGPDA